MCLQHKTFENTVEKGEIVTSKQFLLFVAFVEDNATMSSIWYFENRVSYFVQNQRK